MVATGPRDSGFGDGLELWPYDERSSDGDVGLLVVGAWQLSPAGERFFRIGDEEEA